MNWTSLKSKAFTMSFDDGVTQDIRLIDLLNKYGLKATFNLNSSLLGKPGKIGYNGVFTSHYKIFPKVIRDVLL